MNRINNSSVITDVLWERKVSDNISQNEFRLKLTVPPSIKVVLVGEGDQLGNWQPASGVEMLCEKLPYWYIPSALKVSEGTNYKFVLLEGEDVVAWESGDNRMWIDANKDLGEFRGLPDFRPRMAGIVMPVFSLRGEGCEGIGDFTALGDFAQWASMAGMRVVQTLPVNDTTITHTWKDSYPYNAISTYALHPLYIRVSEIDSSADVSELVALNGLETVDYDRVDALKWTLFRELYERRGGETLCCSEYNDFYNANKYWLKSYAVFSYLRDKFQTSDHSSWDEPYNYYYKELEERVIKENYKEVALYFFLQFHADKQLKAARNKARSCGVVFKGDIPIGVSLNSVEVWKEPHLFNVNGQTGAPPDDFAVEGQNWGFPTYDWYAMSKDNYRWWKQRFEKMADYFDMYRVDHILGFFRIWEIQKPQKSGLMGHFVPALPFSADELRSWGFPMWEERYLGVDDNDPNTLFVRDHSCYSMYHPRISAQFTQRYNEVLDGYEKDRFNAIYNHYFYHRHNDFWAGKALAKLPELIDATSMLCCAEDLGMIPNCVEWVLGQLQIASLEIQRMPKDPHCLFSNTAYYPYQSVAATSTHDMNPIRAWWREDRGLTQRYYNDIMCWGGEAPVDASGEICRWIVEAHLHSPSMAAILPWQDYLAMDEGLRKPDAESERVNVPSNPDNYWNYRMHLSIEQLEKATDFNATLSELVRNSYR